MKREERSEFIKRLRSEQMSCFTQGKEQERLKKQKEEDIKAADEHPILCLSMGEMTPNVFATTVRDEVESAAVFARLLDVKIDTAQTVMAFLEDTFVAWTKINRPLLNPISQRFSPHTTKVQMERQTARYSSPLQPSASKARKLFREKWEFVTPQTDYLRPLADFLTPVEVAAPSQPAVENVEVPQSDRAPIALFSSTITEI
jgi:hypothetical protein